MPTLPSTPAPDTATTPPERINVDQFYEVREWSARLGVTPERLREAVRAVGSCAEDVTAYLRQG
jgi:hypothetical protein